MRKFNVLLLGATGTGKTTSLKTLIAQGITPFIVATEPGIENTLGDTDKSKCHWHYIAPAKTGWSDMIAHAQQINTLSFEALTKIKDMNKQAYGQFIELLTTLSNFKCDRTGESYGSVDSWSTDRALVIDSLSGLNIMAMDLVVGAKPVKAPGDWGVAMDNLERLINRLTCGVNCHFILTGHMDRERDEISGITTLMAATLGQKLAPRIPRFFDDVIQCTHQGTSFYWNTTSNMADLKARLLPLGEKLPADFAGVVAGWKKMGGEILPTQQ